MDPVSAVRGFLDEWKLAPGKLLIAVSGGVDSTALLAALSEMPARDFELEAVHVNHHLRGAASDADEEYVRELCARLEIPLHVCDGTLPEGLIRELGIEAAARRLRYSLLLEVRNRSGAQYIATAHQQNDQAETVLLRLLTGRGPARLQAVQPVTADGIIRPLLRVSRIEIDEFLTSRGIRPRIDESNTNPRFVRNRIRAELLPLLSSINPRISEILADTAELARLQNEAFEKLLEDATRDAIERGRRETVFHLDRLPADPYVRATALLREIVRLDPGARNISSSRLRSVTASLGENCRKRVTRELELVCSSRSAWLHVIYRRDPKPFSVPIEPGQSVKIPGATVSLAAVAASSSLNHREEHVVSQVFELPDSVEPRFSLRNRKPGDRFQPLGLSSPKSLKEFLIDRKVEAQRRDTLPLLLCNNEIVWVAGVEVSERYKVTGSARPLFEITVEYHAEVVDERSGTVLWS